MWKTELKIVLLMEKVLFTAFRPLNLTVTTLSLIQINWRYKIKKSHLLTLSNQSNVGSFYTYS